MAKHPIDAEAARKWIFSQMGYGKPPQHSQFKKGQSGNPLGRPPKPKTPKPETLAPEGRSAADMNKVLHETVKLKEGGKVRDASKAEALQRRMEQMALKGESILLMSDLRRQLLEGDARRTQQIETDHAFWKDYKTNHSRFLATLQIREPLLAEWLPAPEDVILPRGELARYRGAITTAEAVELDLLRRFRDALIVQLTWDIRTAPRRNTDTAETPDQSIIPFHIAALNLLFPARIVLEGEHFWDEVQRLGEWKRQPLERELIRVWGNLGSAPIPDFSQIPFEAIRGKLQRSLKKNGVDIRL